MLKISRESEINLINILIDQDIISGKDLQYIKKVSHLYHGKVKSILVPNNRAVDIDTIDDLNYARYISRVK